MLTTEGGFCEGFLLILEFYEPSVMLLSSMNRVNFRGGIDTHIPTYQTGAG